MEVEQFYLDKISEEQKAFRQLLEEYFPNTVYSNPRILDICCGCINEEPVLLEYFGRETDLIGIDSDPQFEQIAKKLNRKSFKLGDICDLNTLVEGVFDIVIGRNVPLNPNHRDTDEIYSDPWPKIFNSISQYMNTSSQLLLTLCREDEFFRAIEILESNDYQIVLKEKNKIVVPSDKLGVAGADVKDDYIILTQPPR